MWERYVLSLVNRWNCGEIGLIALIDGCWLVGWLVVVAVVGWFVENEGRWCGGD